MSNHETLEGLARVGIVLEVRIQDVPELIRVLGTVAIDGPHIGQESLPFVETMEQVPLREWVSTSDAVRFYQRQFQDDAVSPLAVRFMNRIGQRIAEEAVERDRQGKVIRVSRQAWDAELRKLRTGKDKDAPRTDSKMWRFMQMFDNHIRRLDERAASVSQTQR